MYAIGKTGCEYYQNDYEKERYQRIITFSTDLYKILEERSEENPLGLEIDVMYNWSNQLYDIAKTGLKYTDNSYDIDRFNDVLNVQGEVVSAIDAVSETTVRSMEKGKEDQKPSVANQEFVTDRQIQKRIIEMINSADKEILIASPWIWESEEVLDALRNVVDEKRIRVRIMTRPAKKKADQLHKEQIRMLHKLGFQIELEEKLHAKLILIDESELLIGSANLVGTSLNRNYEAALWTNHNRTVQDAKIYFTGLMEEIFTQKLSK